jgi:tRNA1Val (adenine37-N6)-methyltransferase
LEDIFKFKTFSILQKDNTIKVNQDGILLGTWVDVESDESILDIGTGTGVIAIIVAKRNSEAKIDAIEIDELSCLEAAHNVEQAEIKDKINIIQKSIQNFARESTKTYDHIICNPPFFSGGAISENASSGFRQTVKLGHGELLLAVTGLLKEGGKFSIILPFVDSLRFTELASGYKLNILKKCQIRKSEDAPIQRVLLSFDYKTESNTNSDVSDLVMEDSVGCHSKGYEKLLKGFL